MERRAFLTAALGPLAAGCLGGVPRVTDRTSTPTVDRSAEAQRLVGCEARYIRTTVLDEDERVDGELDPTVVELDSGDDGVYAELRTTFGTVRSAEDAPDEYVDYEVTAYYHRGEDGTFRTSDPNADPTNGTRIYCE